ncbi:MAG: NUDIX domain-containing protein [Patescibacteria group bacterium]|nr:NUDIX domain-containing protein [Patescibacteria group bacterium]MDD5715794.1 NUDIX domain-containing protein [Patescibacteria group bacterium]
MSHPKYIRKVQTSVNNFLFHGDEYLMLHRKPDSWIDPNRLNSIGGRVEPGENFLDAVIRETEEETGYRIASEQITLVGVVKLEGGYDEDWVMLYFKTSVPSKKVPHGTHTKDGDLLWIHKDKVLDSEYELVDDLNYCFKDIVAGDAVFFLTAKLDNNQKVSDVSISKLPYAHGNR